MKMDLKNNPFVKLFPSTIAAEQYVNKVIVAGKTVFLHELKQYENEEPQGNDFLLNLIVEEVFNFTLCKNPPSFKRKSEISLLNLEDVSGNGRLGYDCIDTLELMLFERLLLEEPSKYLIILESSKNHDYTTHVTEKNCLNYLCECYRRLQNKKAEYKTFEKHLSMMTSYVVRNAATALKQPDVYEKQNIHEQLLDLYLAQYSDGSVFEEFLSLVANDINEEEGADGVITAFSPVLTKVQKRLEESPNNILTYDRKLLEFLYLYATIPPLCHVLLKQGKHIEPKSMGRSFSESALGAAFNISILPKDPYLQYEFFENPLDINLKILENQLWGATESLVDILHKIVQLLLKNCRHDTLTWVGTCLEKNAPRGRLSALETLSLDTLSCVSDGFMLNLCAVLLRLTQLFTNSKDNPKLLKIDPTYSAAKVTSDGSNGVHLSSLDSETCLVPMEQNQERPCAGNFSIITEMFFLTHQAVHLGSATVQDRAQRIYQEIGMMQNQLGSDARNDAMELAMTKYLCMRCALIEPSTLAHYGNFVVATCNWLVQVVLDPDLSTDRKSFSPGQFREVSFPLPSTGPPSLRCVPEMLLNNVTHYMVAAKRFEVAGIVIEQLEHLSLILTYLLVFMSGSVRVRNPHLRAHLAECLECLVPVEKPGSNLSVFCRQQLFNTHPHRHYKGIYRKPSVGPGAAEDIIRALRIMASLQPHDSCRETFTSLQSLTVIVESLLDVFVGIEMTGQSVTFEQKFNYRRPMYTVMEYLWSLDEQKLSFQKLAAEAEANMEAVNPPLFLRFLNLLMNDAVFLLDEALNNMASLKNMIAAREAGEWENLAPNERQRNETNIVHVGMTARFDNILGTKTIECLVYLSSEIKTIFCHPTMVDRIAAMLNYFLLHLVGPKKKNFKVKDQLKDYMFDPAAIVLNICRIYIHLIDSDEFCAAVSRDGRSYSPQLFSFAENVLIRTGGGQYVADLLEVAARVGRFASLQQQEEELLAEVPDEFLDPIMSTIMTDPVVLPSSKQIVDRSTIARHLLSDQSDPFNREPLTMDMVKSATEVKQRIDDWVAQRHSSSTASSSHVHETMDLC